MPHELYRACVEACNDRATAGRHCAEACLHCAKECRSVIRGASGIPAPRAGA